MGFYDSVDPHVVCAQIKYIKDFGFDFVAYDWFWGRHYFHNINDPQAYYPGHTPNAAAGYVRAKIPGMEDMNAPLNAMLAQNDKFPTAKKMKFALNWSEDSLGRWLEWLKIETNPGNLPNEKASKELYFAVHEKMTQLWIDKYFKRADYLLSPDGRPVVYVLNPGDQAFKAAYYGLTMRQLLNRSVQLAQSRGLKGIKFIAVSAGPMLESHRMYGVPTRWSVPSGKKPWEGKMEGRLLFQEHYAQLPAMGFEGMTTYVYHSYDYHENRSYDDMRATYQLHWDRWKNTATVNSNMEYQVPVAMGWDRRPGGGSWPQTTGFPSDPSLDRVRSTPSTFGKKLESAKSVADRYTKPKEHNTIMVCCWNEYIEGNHIEPSVTYGTQYLEEIRRVFGIN